MSACNCLVQTRSLARSSIYVTTDVQKPANDGQVTVPGSQVQAGSGVNVIWVVTGQNLTKTSTIRALEHYVDHLLMPKLGGQVESRLPCAILNRWVCAVCQQQFHNAVVSVLRGDVKRR